MYDIEWIRTILPHRFPMLLVDRIEELEQGRSARGVKNVTINEWFFQGHFPGQAIMPGVLVLEAMAQVGGVLMLSLPNYGSRVPLLGGVDNARFRRPVVPGDTLITEASVIYFRKGFGKMKLVGRVQGEIAAVAEMTFALVDGDPTVKAPAADPEG
jgi:3-hydroxyacyl-[acyl-carrier-protein] dehydratase